MEGKGAGSKDANLEDDLSKNLLKAYVEEQLKIHKAFIAKVDKHYDTLYQILAMHPTSPELEFNVRRLSDEDFKDHHERILTGWKNVELAPEALEAHVQDFAEPDVLDSEDTTCLLGATAAPPKKGIMGYISIFGTRSHKAKDANAPPVDTGENKSIFQRLFKAANKEWAVIKEKATTARRESVDNPIPSIPRPNTPVERSEKTMEIEDMIIETQITQFGHRMFADEIGNFELKYSEKCSIYSSKATRTRLNPKCSEQLRADMKVLLILRANDDLVVNLLDSKLRKKKLFLECEERYKMQNIAKRKTEERVKGMAGAGSSGTQKKGKRKSLAIEDDLYKFPAHSPAKQKREPGSSKKEPDVKDLMEFSPEKQSKEEADADSKEVVRRLRKTSMTDDDDDIKDIL